MNMENVTNDYILKLLLSKQAITQLCKVVVKIAINRYSRFWFKRVDK